MIKALEPITKKSGKMKTQNYQNRIVQRSKFNVTKKENSEQTLPKIRVPNYLQIVRVIVVVASVLG